MSHSPHHRQDGHCHAPEHGESTRSRRDFLKLAFGSLFGLAVGAPLIGIATGNQRASGLTSLWAADPLGDPTRVAELSPRIRSVIALWMDGGPSQLDTWDPKPGSANGGPFRAIRTSQRGLEICEHMPQLAELGDRLAVIRSMSTREGNHQRARHLLKTSYVPQGTVAFPGIGATFARELHDPALAIPPNVAINAPGISSGYLGVRFDPLFVKDPAEPPRNLAPAKGITEARMERRARLLAAQQDAFRGIAGDHATARDHDQIAASARAFMAAPEAKAFDISEEPEALRAAYGDTKFGRGCLMARRLVEAGVKFVEVTLGGWDTHDDNFTRTRELMGTLDPAMATLIRDLGERGLLDSTLVLWMGEFGRTPRINSREGRDHFPAAWCAALAGGGIVPQVYGATADDGMRVVDRPVTPASLFRTVFRQAGIDPDRMYTAPSGRPIRLVDQGEAIGALTGRS
jgi:uncharacterized protein (DUF1501 family)